MEIQILGAHMTETATSRFPSLLIDGTLALDAGGLSSSLSLSDQQKLKAILLTHYHYDHIKDIPTLGMNFYHFERTLDIYSIPPVFEMISSNLLADGIYPKFFQWPEEKPALNFIVMEPYQPMNIDNYSILAVPVFHGVPAVGFQVTSAGGKRLFYTGDTGIGLSACWEYVSPDLLITEVSMPQRLEKRAVDAGHLSPQSLKSELLQFRKVKGYLPHIYIVHLNPFFEDEIEREVAEVAEELGVNITLGKEKMRISV